MISWFISFDPDDGVLVQVEVGISRTRRGLLQQAQRAIPASTRLTALVDTGADITCIDAKMLRQMPLPMNLSFLSVNAPGLSLPTGFRPTYEVGLELLPPTGIALQPLVVPDVLVAEVDLPRGIEVLLGRDVLKNLDFSYSGLRSEFTVSYP